MKFLALQLVIALAVLSAVVVLCDTLVRAYAALQRRRKVRDGTFGVVVDREGRVLGTYLDPFSRTRRSARVHAEDSPWSVLGPDGRKQWAWEGFGATEEEARIAANRLRNRHLRLLPWLAATDEGGEEDSHPFRSPSAPPI